MAKNWLVLAYYYKKLIMDNMDVNVEWEHHVNPILQDIHCNSDGYFNSQDVSKNCGLRFN